MMHRRFTDRRVALLGIAAALALGCEKLLGIHDLDGGTGASGSDDSRLPFSGSDSGSSYSGFSSGASSGIPGSGTISGAGESSGGSSSGSTSGSSSGTTGAIMLTGLACTISSATHWTAGVYLADCNIQVDGALTIDPGAIIKFTAGHSMSVSGSGAITALGSDTMPIVFTSIKDDTHGGNTGGNTPAVGDWNGITLDASGSTLDHCGFYYAGASDTPALVIKSQATVTNSIFAHNRGPTDSPYAAPALDASDAAAQTAIKSNTFYDNRVPLRIGRNVSLDDSNSFDNSVAAPMNRQPNQFNGIEFASASSSCNSNSDIVSRIAWSATKVPLIIGDPSRTWLCVNSGGQLTLGPNVVLKFFPGGNLEVAQSGVTGTLTTNSGDTFTSIRDDAHGGDTNADQASSAPAPGDWNGVVLNASGSTFDHCAFYYAGGSDTPALAINQGQATVTNSIFAHNSGPTNSLNAALLAPALDASGAAAQTAIKSNTFYDNRVPLRIGPNVSLDDSNSFDNGVAAPMNRQPNEFNGIEFASLSYCNANTDIVNSITWFATKVPFIIGNPSSTWLCVDGQLTLGPNVILKFFPGGKLEVAQSGATGTQTTSSGDIFTSIKDDANGGDTNGDMAATTPMAGDWLGVVENSVCETWPNILFSTVGCQ